MADASAVAVVSVLALAGTRRPQERPWRLEPGTPQEATTRNAMALVAPQCKGIEPRDPY